MNILVFILTLSILVLIHEFGHFLAAKKRGVLVEEFGLGLPPRIAGIKIGETIYSINFLPFGGFVKLYGEDGEERMNHKLKSRAFSYKKNWEKFLIIVAGVIGNFLLAWLLFSYLFTQGVHVPTNQVKIEKVASGSPAEKVGIVPGDVIKKIILKQDNKAYPMSSGADLISITKKYAGKEIILVVKRNNEEINKTITPRLSPPPGQGPLGIVISSFEEKKYPWYQAPFYGLIDSLKITFRIFAELSKTLFTLLISQKNNVDVAGPIGIAYYTSEIIKFGKNAYLEFLALLSLNLAVINLLPFPALDGGRLAFVIYESITKKKIKKELERNLNMIGFIILIFLAIIISINDVMKLIK